MIVMSSSRLTLQTRTENQRRTNEQLSVELATDPRAYHLQGRCTDIQNLCIFNTVISVRPASSRDIFAFVAVCRHLATTNWRRAVAARILATLSANERLKSSALNAEEYEKLSRQSRTLTAGHSQTTRVCEDQHGQLQSAQTRTQRTCAGDADDKYAAGCTRRPWRH